MSSDFLPPENGSLASDPPGEDMLAAELVLGVLNREERTSAQGRLEVDTAFARRVSFWESRFAAWLTDIRPVSVPAHLWPQITRSLSWDSERPAPKGLWQSLALWRSVAAVAALSAVGLWLVRAPTPPAPVSTVRTGNVEPGARPVTTLAQDDGRPGWLASIDATRGTVLMVPVPRAADAQGRVPELWIIPAGKPPRSLGVVSIDKSHTVPVPADARAALLAAGSVLAVTLEPAAGVPHGAPTGPIIAKGEIRS